jgi:hypothetical protein
MYDYFLEREPLYFDEKNGVWEVFRYDDIVTIERDTEAFINGEGVRPNIPPDPGMIYQDGEQHNKQRALVSSGFTPRQMRKMEDRAREIVVELVDTMLGKDEVEIVADLAGALPARLIADMLNIPEEKRAAVMEWINQIMIGGCGPEYVTDEVNDAFEEFCMHHEEMYQDRIAAGCKGSDLLTIWMNAEINGEKLDESQLLFEHVLLNVGGAETTRSAIAGSVTHPERGRRDHPLGLPVRKHVPNRDSRLRDARQGHQRGADGRTHLSGREPGSAQVQGSAHVQHLSGFLEGGEASRFWARPPLLPGRVACAPGGAPLARGDDAKGEEHSPRRRQRAPVRVVVVHARPQELPSRPRTPLGRLRRGFRSRRRKNAL